MKTNFIGAVVLCAVISLTLGSEYQYYDDNNKTCIEVKTDVKFTLTNGKETIEFDGTNFTVKSGDCASPSESVATLILTTVKEDLLSLEFKTNAQKEASMGAMFTFSPDEYFPETPEATAINLIDTGDQILGNNTQLFQCNSIQTLTLNGTLKDTTYTMYMDMTNTQIQAFDIKNGKLSSDVFVCSADQMTTTAQNVSTEQVTTATSSGTTEATTATTNVTAQTTPTTPNATSEAPTTNSTMEPTTKANTTAEGPSTAPTTAPTTAAPTPMPPKSTYKVMAGGKTCLIMEGSFQMMVTINKTTIIVDVPLSNEVNVTGICASKNETESSITITPKSGPLKSLTFDFKINKNKDMADKSELVSMSAEVMVDGKVEPISANKTLLVLSNPKLFYKCDVGSNFTADKVIFKYEQLKVQAFNVENEKFAENGEDCSEDVGPIPAPGNIPVNTYAVTEGNKTCIVFKGSMKFVIPYVAKSGNATEPVGLPEKFTVSGSCNFLLNGEVSQKMEVKFYEDWILTIYFTDSDNKTDVQNQLTADSSDKYYISQIELEYEYNSNLFVKADESILGKKAKFTAANLTLWETGKGKSYMCNKESTINLSSKDGFELTVSKVQYQAFKKGNSNAFGDASECAADEETNSIVPIAVGAALAGLVIIVLIAYLIGRKRSRAGYEQV